MHIYAKFNDKKKHWISIRTYKEKIISYIIEINIIMKADFRISYTKCKKFHMYYSNSSKS